MLIFSFNTFAQNYISTKTTPGSGNIYHTGGNLGIGTTEPQTLINISNDTPINISFLKQGVYIVQLKINQDIYYSKIIKN